MAVFHIPYARHSLELEIPDSRIAGVLESRIDACPVPERPEAVIEDTLDHPIGPRLEQWARGKKNIVILSSDHTRPVPSRITMPALLARIRRSAPDAQVTILVATGFHRASTKEELRDRYGDGIIHSERIEVHDSRDAESLVDLGPLPSGSSLWLNRIAAEADLLCAEGFIEPHFFAGFSGGRKSVLPGIAGYRTVLENHCAPFIENPRARAGILKGNPLHRDMAAAARRAKLAFILNVVQNGRHEIIRVFAGHPDKAHRKGCRFLSSLCRVPRIEADIVITSNGGYPLDQNIYQAVKGMTAAEACCKKNGVIIMASACNDGHGGSSFYENMAGAASPAEVLERVRAVPMHETVPDQWEFQILARILSRHSVILVTGECDPGMIRSMHMDHAFTLQEALEKAFKKCGDEARIAVIPNGVSVIVHERAGQAASFRRISI